VNSGDESVGESGVGVEQTEKGSEARRRTQEKEIPAEEKGEGVESEG